MHQRRATVSALSLEPLSLEPLLRATGFSGGETGRCNPPSTASRYVGSLTSHSSITRRSCCHGCPCPEKPMQRSSISNKNTAEEEEKKAPIHTPHLQLGTRFCRLVQLFTLNLKILSHLVPCHTNSLTVLNRARHIDLLVKVPVGCVLDKLT